MKIPCSLCHKEVIEEDLTWYLATAVHKECLNHPIVKAIELIGKGQSFLNQIKLWDVLKGFQGEILRKYITRREKKENVQY